MRPPTTDPPSDALPSSRHDADRKRQRTDGTIVPSERSPDDKRAARNKSQREWAQRKARKVLLAEVPLSLATRRMLVSYGGVPAADINNKKAVGLAAAAALEDLLQLARHK